MIYMIKSWKKKYEYKYWLILYILIDFEEFTNSNNLLTPTMKIIRKNVEIKYKERIDNLYEKISKEKGKN